jgi:hypothetical protein
MTPNKITKVILSPFGRQGFALRGFAAERSEIKPVGFYWTYL